MLSSRDLMIVAALKDLVLNESSESRPPAVTQWMQTKIDQLEKENNAISKKVPA